MEKVVDLGFGILDYCHPNILKYTVVDGDNTINQMNQYFDISYKLLDSSNEPFVILFDATKGKLLSSEVRIAMGKRTNEREERYADRYIKSFIVIPNALTNMMLKGINLLKKQRVKQSVYSTIEAAYEGALKEVESWNK